MRAFFNGNERLCQIVGMLDKGTQLGYTFNGIRSVHRCRAHCNYGPICSQAPGSILQLHPDFTLVADEAALSLVKDLL